MNNGQTRLNLNQLEEIFDDDEYLETIQQPEEFDSAIKISIRKPKFKNPIQSSTDTIIHENLNTSPKNQNNKVTTSVRCSFGINSHQKTKFHLPNSNQSSVHNSLQFNQSPRESQGTAQFMKFVLKKPFENIFQSTIEEQNEQESSVNQSRETRLSKANTDEGIQEFPQSEEDEQSNYDVELEQASHDLNFQSKEQQEYYLTQMAYEMQRIQSENQQLTEQLIKSDAKIKSLRKMTREITVTLDQTQEHLMKLYEENQQLKKKQYLHSRIKTQDDSESQQFLKKFFTTQQEISDQMTNGNQNILPNKKIIKRNCNSSSSNENKENLDNNTNLLNQIGRMIQAPSNTPQQVLRKITSIQETTHILTDALLLVQSTISKLFNQENGIDKEGKEASVKLLEAINQNQFQQVLTLTSKLVAVFERKLKQQFTKQKFTQGIISQIQKLVVVQ